MLLVTRAVCARLESFKPKNKQPRRANGAEWKYYGIFRFSWHPLGYVLQWMYDLFGSYGWALIVFTVAVRLLSFPLQVGQQKNTARMAAYKPMIDEIQKKYAKDRGKAERGAHAPAAGVRLQPPPPAACPCW